MAASTRGLSASARAELDVRVEGKVLTWLERDVLPNVIELEHADAYPTEMVEQMREFGLFGATIPTEYGGLGLSTTVYAEIVTQISAVWMSLTGVLNSHLMMAHLIRMFGTDEQRADFLPKLASGELRGGLALTEPTAAPTCRRSA